MKEFLEKHFEIYDCKQSVISGGTFGEISEEISGWVYEGLFKSMHSGSAIGH